MKQTSIGTPKSPFSVEGMLPPSTTLMERSRVSISGLPPNLRDVAIVNGKTYIKLKQIGSGGTSKVYRVLDEKSEIYALKCINLENVSETDVANYLNEVTLLEKLRGSPGIIHMFEYELIPNKMMNIVRSEQPLVSHI